MKIIQKLKATAILAFLTCCMGSHAVASGHNVPTQSKKVPLESGNFAIAADWIIREGGRMEVGRLTVTIEIKGSTLNYTVMSQGKNKTYSAGEGLSFRLLKDGSPRGAKTHMHKVRFDYRSPTTARGSVEIPGVFGADEVELVLQGGTWPHD